jgi:hypothetical protein
MARLATAPLACHIASSLKNIGEIPGSSFVNAPTNNVEFSIGAILGTSSGTTNFKTVLVEEFPFHFMIIRDNISRTMSSVVAYGDQPGNVMLSEQKSVASANAGDMKAYLSFEFHAGCFTHTPEKVHMCENVGYINYNGGKDCEYVDFNDNDDAGADNPHALTAWHSNVSHARGDMIITALPFGYAEKLQYASLTGTFDTKGFPLERRMPHNSGYFPGQQFVYHRMGLHQIDEGRTPETEYMVAAQANTLLTLGTLWTGGPEEKIISSGVNSLDGGDYEGVKAIRQGREFTHEHLHAMRKRGANK